MRDIPYQVTRRRPPGPRALARLGALRARARSILATAAAIAIGLGGTALLAPAAHASIQVDRWTVCNADFCDGDWVAFQVGYSFVVEELPRVLVPCGGCRMTQADATAIANRIKDMNRAQSPAGPVEAQSVVVVENSTTTKVDVCSYGTAQDRQTPNPGPTARLRIAERAIQAREAAFGRAPSNGTFYLITWPSGGTDLYFWLNGGVVSDHNNNQGQNTSGSRDGCPSTAPSSSGAGGGVRAAGSIRRMAP